MASNNAAAQAMNPMMVKMQWFNLIEKVATANNVPPPVGGPPTREQMITIFGLVGGDSSTSIITPDALKAVLLAGDPGLASDPSVTPDGAVRMLIEGAAGAGAESVTFDQFAQLFVF